MTAETVDKVTGEISPTPYQLLPRGRGVTNGVGRQSRSVLRRPSTAIKGLLPFSVLPTAAPHTGP